VTFNVLLSFYNLKRTQAGGVPKYQQVHGTVNLLFRWLDLQPGYFVA